MVRCFTALLLVADSFEFFSQAAANAVNVSLLLEQSPNGKVAASLAIVQLTKA